MVLRWDSLLDNINNVEVTVGWKLDPAILVHGARSTADAWVSGGVRYVMCLMYGTGEYATRLTGIQS